MKFEFRIILLLATALLLTGLPQACADDAPGSVLDSLETKHPRLMLKEPALQNLKERAKKDVALQGLVRGVNNKADDCLAEPMLTYTKRGPRLLHVSKACLDRIYELGVAWRWTGDPKYAEKIEQNLLAVCAFPDWSPSHFLDTAEMAHAVESAEQAPPQKRNKGISRLVIRLPETQGPLTIAVLLSPQWEDGVIVKKMVMKPLKEW